MIQLHAEGRLGPVVVVALGTNGPIGDDDLGRMMAELAGVPLVVDRHDKADRRLRRRQQRQAARPPGDATPT